MMLGADQLATTPLAGAVNVVSGGPRAFATGHKVETPSQLHPRVELGLRMGAASLGAPFGETIGQMIGHSPEAALVGVFAGALAGWLGYRLVSGRYPR
jgi:hypothetical protein